MIGECDDEVMGGATEDEVVKEEEVEEEEGERWREEKEVREEQEEVDDGVDMEEKAGGRMVLMWGYLPGVSQQRAPLLTPTPVTLPEGSWKDVCGGGCGFAVAISESGKVITWGSTDDLGQSYLTSGKHEEIPEAFPLPTDAPIVRAAAGWAHCVSVTDHGEVYTWGWKECVPSGKSTDEQAAEGAPEKEHAEKQNGHVDDQVSPRSQASKCCNGVSTGADHKGGEDGAKRRKLSSSKHTSENSSIEETLSAFPCLVTFSVGVKISVVAAGGRHTLALSDVGQVWGWGYGGEGQLGLGTRTRMVSSPHLVPCVDSRRYCKGQSESSIEGEACTNGQLHQVTGTSVKAIACGGRHSAVVTDNGELLTFGWGLYGQCGQGSTDDELSPTCVSSLLGIHIQGIAAGLWHTVCTSDEGDIYAFGGNQFGQLGTGSDQAETLPKLLESSCLEDITANEVSCGARHTAIVTDDGKVFCWGWNKYGQLGVGDAIDRNLPSEVAIQGLPKSVACGWWHTLVLAESPT